MGRIRKQKVPKKVPKKKNLLMIGRGKLFILKPKELKKYAVMFPDMDESIGIAVKMKDGSRIFYHKHYKDGKKSFINSLKEFGVKGENIESVEIFGGCVNSMSYPLEGETVCVYRLPVNEDNSPQVGANGKVSVSLTSYVHTKDERMPWSGKRFEVALLGNGQSVIPRPGRPDYVSKMEPISPSSIADKTEQAKLISDVEQFLKKNNCTSILNWFEVDQKTGQKFLNRASFHVSSIENFIGSRNVKIVQDLLKTNFPEIDRDGFQMTHRYVPVTSSLVIDNDNPSLYPGGERDLLASHYSYGYAPSNPLMVEEFDPNDNEMPLPTEENSRCGYTYCVRGRSNIDEIFAEGFKKGANAPGEVPNVSYSLNVVHNNDDEALLGAVGGVALEDEIKNALRLEDPALPGEGGNSSSKWRQREGERNSRTGGRQL